MDWSSVWNTVAGVGSSVIGGGALGIIGTGIQAYTAFQNRKLDLEITKINREADYKEQQLEGENAAKLQVIREDGASERSADTLRVASYQNDKPLTLGRKAPRGVVDKVTYFFASLADTLNRLIRPLATIGLTVAVLMLTRATLDLYKGLAVLPPATVSTLEAVWVLLMRIVDMVLFLWAMSYTWFFGGRALKPSEIQQMGKR